ncbi:DUF4365 domain-containing protein [Streptomyces sp. NPDC127038]|uniref:DUF4365 domain-containing protein n=1 Tax=Streptomyces sp. NPDC127038 TaxID=3347114 RepID=UPI00364A5205
MDEAERAGIPASAHKERASYFALGLLANSAFCHLQDPHLDYDCLDVTVLGSGPFKVRGPRFDVQLKSTSSARKLGTGDYAITLPAAQYQHLRRPGYAPMRLVVLILPTGVEVPQTRSVNGHLILDGVMLWSDPATWEPLPPGQKSGTVALERKNEFTAEYIREMIKHEGNGGGR